MNKYPHFRVGVLIGALLGLVFAMIWQHLRWRRALDLPEVKRARRQIREVLE